jgi:hypothetical protein
MTKSEGLAFIGGAAFAGLGSLALHVYAAYDPRTLTESAYAGDSLEIRLSPEACAGPLARTELNCEYAYFGNRSSLKNTWWFTGRKRGAAAPESNEASNAPNEPGALSLWGIVAKFDDAGHLSYGGKEIGTVQLTTRGLRSLSRRGT